MSYLSGPIGVVLPVDALQSLAAVEAELIIAGIGVDNICAIVCSGDFASALECLLAKGHSEPYGHEPE